MSYLLDTHTFLWFIGDIAQAITENLSILGRDAQFSQYPIKILW